jgi:hypothetical protein
VAAASKLRDFLHDEAAMKRARDASGSLARDRFSRDKLASDLIHVLERAASERPAPSMRSHLAGKGA